nr:hypothetical protein Iba_chr05cCG2880 [Ipomoea batatas]
MWILSATENGYNIELSIFQVIYKMKVRSGNVKRMQKVGPIDPQGQIKWFGLGVKENQFGPVLLAQQASIPEEEGLFTPKEADSKLAGKGCDLSKLAEAAGY